MKPRRPIGFWLKLVDGLIEQRLDATLGQWSLTRRQWQILNVLRDAPRSEEQIGGALEPFGRETVSSALSDLAARELVSADGEAWRLTAAGETTLGEAHREVMKDRQRLADGIDEPDHTRVIETLRRMATNLGWRDDG